MRSNRYHKIILGFRHWLKGEELQFDFPISQDATCHCQFEIWKKQLFQSIEKGPSMQAVIEDLMEWLQLPSQMLGKRSGQIVLSKSKQYCLKSIEDEDLETFQKMLQDYALFKSNKEISLLVPIYAVFRLHSDTPKRKPTVDNYIVMPNIKIEEPFVFDIKGHCDNRMVDEADFKIFKFGKDQNLTKSELLELVRELPSPQKKHILHLVEENTNFLRAHNIIDYSFMMIFVEDDHGDVQSKSGDKGMGRMRLNEQYWLEYGVIDFMQVYNERKKLQNKVKSFFFKEVSSVDPETYSTRLLHFLQKCLLD